MNSKNQQAAIRYLLENVEATPRELLMLLAKSLRFQSCDRKTDTTENRSSAGMPPQLERVSGTQNFWEQPGSR
ncbi:TPA: hypothetical protein J1420_004461 [Escherichia coli]|uniref:Uncharacterized protein n=1 Tax=Escherichia marmotae TaxID=1499973 RepID=A0ABU1BWM7_9ESCH|nr:hypothetical protein [Escherichia marmotae]MEC9922021.1 hypothetical protein [Escherichia coli]MDE9782598.1 hypothetical protein [Escherichia marmotae]MDQ9226634.1 hypothetical protein [Escherichia marmotae]MDQ9292768.1 hypothetical protein [Escherichia marmotae]MED8754070.1 hypothetical protein [Escherichia marmotae]